MDYSKDNSGHFDSQLFADYSEKLMVLFSEYFKENHDFLFQRALLAKGNYLVDINRNKTFCIYDSALRAKIDNWRKVFNDKQKTLFLKELLDSIDKNNIEGGLNEIINGYQDVNWRRYVVENPQFISYCQKRQIRFRDKDYGENKIFLLSKSQMNGKHVELNSYYLFKKMVEYNRFPPFSTTWYYESNSYLDPCIVLEAWSYKENIFLMDIGATNNGFSFKFFDSNKNDIPLIIKTKLLELGFNGSLQFHLKDSDIDFTNVISEIERVCNELNTFAN